MSSLTLLGILDDAADSLSPRARAALASADHVIGVERTLALVRPLLPAHTSLQAMDQKLSQVGHWLREAQAQQKNTVVLTTGDPLCHGLGAFLARQEGCEALVIEPATSTLQAAFARFKKPWQTAFIASCHGRDDGPWHFGATPAHGLYAAVRALTLHPLCAIFTSPQNSPARLARALLDCGFEDDEFHFYIASRLHRSDERLWHKPGLTAAAQTHFDDPNILIAEHSPRHRPPAALFGLADESYQQRKPDKGLITKLEARALTLAKLQLRRDSVVWDIGAGSGSVGLEAARIACDGHVWAIEKNDADFAIAQNNARTLRASNYTLLQGRAPAHLEQFAAPDAVFIGGSGGELSALIETALARLQAGGRLVMNFVALENLHRAQQTLNAHGLEWQLTQLNAARSQPILNMHRLAAENPLWLLSTTLPFPSSEPSV